eukprot:CAMPEP_0116932116 /NCGR_PEP_ID=MMETSP0467-20121206/28236_1 /TAXON_ID=283647 /ORGANISM="Mesodinium pulex, Strain SPMC105" /LENGTH=122 /DNA_ID=CAMNT_0004612717 /DNA_START=395 /DNA_END=763 /DNA_ORIENTATION=-
MTDIGVSCAKESYNRGVGKPLQCSDDEEEDAALCYNKCANGTGVGPVCWGSCPAGTAECGGVLCLSPGQTCTTHLKTIITDLIGSVEEIAKKSASGSIIDLSKLAKDLTYGVCTNWNTLLIE